MKQSFILFLGVCGVLMSTSAAAQMGYSSYPSANTSSFSGSSYSSSPTYSQINWAANYGDAIAQAQATSKPIAILFTGSGWCPACVRLERTVVSQPDFAKAVGEQFIFLKADFPTYNESSVASSPFKPLLDRYGVTQFPTFIIINANGEKLFTVDYREGGVQAYAQEMQQKLLAIRNR